MAAPVQRHKSNNSPTPSPTMDDETATDLDSNVEGEDIHLEGKNEFDLN
jgi:hypothetical protein